MPDFRIDYQHFLDLSDFAPDELRHLLDAAAARKARRLKLLRPPQAYVPQAQPDEDAPLAGHLLGLVFQGASTRTRMSMDVAMRQLGGETLTLRKQEMQWGRGEIMPDTMAVMSRMLDLVALRLADHNDLHIFAANARIPVINAMTNFSHPCQVIADILTFEEHKGPIAGRKLAWLGANSNVATSWVHAAGMLGFDLHVGSPFQFSGSIQNWIGMHPKKTGANIVFHKDPKPAAEGAAALVTDCWLSVGDDPGKAEEHAKLLAPFRVTDELMALGDDAIFMHCLPAHRGEEVTEEVMASPRAVVWDEAENRIHAQKAILLWCLKRLG